MRQKSTTTRQGATPPYRVPVKRKSRTLEGIMSVPPSLRLTEEELQTRLGVLETMSGSELRREYRRVWGTEAYSHNYAVLRSRIAWRLYTFCHGSLSRAVIAKARSLADASQMRERAPKVFRSKVKKQRTTKPTVIEPSVPGEATPSEWMSTVGHVLVKQFRGTRYEIHALPQGRCHCNGATFASLTAAARAIAGYKCSGNVFFRSSEQKAHI